MTSANIQHKNTFLNWRISFVVGLGLFSDLDATSSYDIATIAGITYAGDSGRATSAWLGSPYGACIDGSNNIYIADSNNNRIRMIWNAATNGTYTNGNIYTIAGNGMSGYGGDGASAVSAILNGPSGIFVSGSNIYFSDTGNNCIRKFTLGGTVSTLAGTGTVGSANGAAASATFNSPRGIYLDSSNNVYIADSGNNLIRKIVSTTVSTLGVSTALNKPSGVFVSGTTVYVADTGNNRIRSISTTGTSSTPFALVAGTGAQGNANGVATTVATFINPCGVFVSGSNTYIVDTGNNIIRKLVSTTVSTISGVAGGFSGDSASATSALLNGPREACVDSSGNIYISDTNNNRIRKITASSNIISTIAGTGAASYSGVDEVATSATLNNQAGIAVDTAGNVYIADSSNNRIRMVWNAATNGTYTNGNIYTIAGGATAGSTGDNGPASSALLSSSFGVFVNGSNIYIADTGNNRIRKFTLGGNISTIVGGATAGSTGDNGLATSALLNGPQDVFVDSAGNIYIADTGNNRIRMVWNAATNGTYTNGNIYTIAGTGTANYSGDNGLATSAALNGPRGVCVDSFGNICVADSNNNVIRKLTLGDTISTIAGTNSSGITVIAALSGPRRVQLGSFGNIYIADTFNNVIRKLLSKLTVSGGGTLSATATGTAYIQDGGTAVLPASNSISAVEVNNGTLQVSSSAPITFNASGGSAIVEILAAINTGAFTFNTPGAVKIATGIAAILDAPSGSGTMSKTGAGRLRAIANLSSSTTPVAVSEGILEVSGTGKLPNAATSVASGATLQLGTSGGTVVPGAVANASVASGGIMSILAGATGAVTTATIASGGVLSVAAGVTAPNGMFTSATFRSGGILQVGDGATLGQSFNSVA